MNDWEVAFKEKGFESNSRLIDRLRSLTHWHFEFAKQHSASFSSVLALIEALELEPHSSSLQIRGLHSFQKGMQPGARKVLEYEICTLSELPVFSAPGRTYRTAKKKSRTHQEILRESIARQKRQVESDATLFEHFSNALMSFNDERKSKILAGRLGINKPNSLTLDEVGREIGITRQRVKQIEQTLLMTMEKYALWDDIFRDKCEQIFNVAGPLIVVEDLASLDEWFSGFSLPKSGWRIFLKYFAGYFVIVDENEVIALSPYEASDRIQTELQQVRAALSNGLTKQAVSDKIMSASDSLVDRGKYFSSALLRLAGNPRINKRAMIRNVINDADNPVTLENVIAECARRSFYVDLSDFTYVKNILSETAVPISRMPTTFVTRRSIGLDELQIRQYCDAFHSYWLDNFDIERTFHGEEVKVWAQLNRYEQSLSDTNWMYTAILKLDPENRFSADKLNIWLTEAWIETPPPSIAELTEELLRVKGVPLTRTEIVEYLYPKRGLGTNFQIHEEGRIRALGGGLWGYRET